MCIYINTILSATCLEEDLLLPVIIDKLQIVNDVANPIQFQGETKIFYIHTVKKYNKKFCIYFVVKKYR